MKNLAKLASFSPFRILLHRLSKKTEYVFGSNSKTARSSAYYTERRKIASKLGNPRILKIGLHTFRHWKATMLYHETHDIILVKEFLGHNTALRSD